MALAQNTSCKSTATKLLTITTNLFKQPNH